MDAGNNTSFDVIAEAIKNYFNKRDTGFFNVFDKFIKAKQSIYTAKHIYKFIRLRNLLEDLQAEEKEKISFIKITPAFFESFFSFLINNKGMLTNTANKQISFLKTFLIWANVNNHCNNNSYKSFRGKSETNEIIYLTEHELMTLYNITDKDLVEYYLPDKNENSKKPGLETLLRVRDLFCFQCFTGVRYGDIERISRDDIKGPVWRLRTQKTKQLLDIPLNDFAITILSKYQDYPQPLPVMSNQKVNEYLKELCKASGIDDTVKIVKYKGKEIEETVCKKYEVIASHTARRTFVSLSLQKGMKPENIMRITGHSSYRMMQKYLKIDYSHLREEMDKVWGSPLKLVEK